jgi:tol-pal system protein YbgF
MITLRRILPVGVLVLTGCLASKGDVMILQNELRTMAATQAQMDAAQRAKIDQLLTQIQRNNDSVRAVSARLARFQGDVQNAQYDMNKQLLTIQELTGQSQRRMQELRASLEERQQAVTTAAPVVDTTARPAAAGPGPGQLFQSSLDQLRRGSTAVARSGFEELLRTYPSYEDAPEAMFYVAETYAAERNTTAADSVYGLVVQKYPTSPKAATALYKQAQSLRAAGKNTLARATFNRIVKDYPRSDEAELAREQLRTLK